jgi:hypothetical protein
VNFVMGRGSKIIVQKCTTFLLPSSTTAATDAFYNFDTTTSLRASDLRNYVHVCGFYNK